MAFYRLWPNFTPAAEWEKVRDEDTISVRKYLRSFASPPTLSCSFALVFPVARRRINISVTVTLLVGTVHGNFCPGAGDRTTKRIQDTPAGSRDKEHLTLVDAPLFRRASATNETSIDNVGRN
ncbi:hypothetical protein KM043_004569 [Ampulex compressa]|nr:hypothetical protein KM043_004569 [Ampulex compressa]